MKNKSNSLFHVHITVHRWVAPKCLEYKEINDFEIGCNFFESFMVIGADKKELL